MHACLAQGGIGGRGFLTLAIQWVYDPKCEPKKNWVSKILSPTRNDPADEEGPEDEPCDEEYVVSRAG